MTDHGFKKPIPVGEIKNERQTGSSPPASQNSLAADLNANVQLFQTRLKNTSDLIIRRFLWSATPQIELAVIFIDGLIDSRVLDQGILRPLLTSQRQDLDQDGPTSEEALQIIENRLLTAGEIERTGDLDTLLHTLLSGDTLLLAADSSEAIVINSRGFPSRSVGEPSTEAVVRGPREGFTESLRTNTALVRRRLKDPDLVVEPMTLGQRTATDIAVVYVDDLVNTKVLQEIKERLGQQSIDAILESGYIEQLLQDCTMSPFPQMQATERPDKVVGGLLEGRVAIIVDGSPFALLVPAVWAQFFQSPEDYYERAQAASFIRIIRLLANSFSLFLPALYIALTSFHPEMLPTSLALALVAARAGVPFSVLAETLIMEMSVEIVREASIRLPGPVGPTIGIVGGLILGEAAVQAKIVSPLTVIVVAITAIGSLATPSYSSALTIRLLRFFFVLAAASFGLIGITAGIIVVVTHLAGLESFGVPYLAPYAPFKTLAKGDTVVRRSFPFQRTRPEFLNPQDRHRMPDAMERKESDDEPDGL